MTIAELKRECLAAIESRPSLRGAILDLFYNAEDDSEAGDESFECMLAHDALEALLDAADVIDEDAAVLIDIAAYTDGEDDEDDDDR